MKKVFFTLIALLLVCCLNAQTLTVSITGSAKGGIQIDEIYQRIDSIEVVNLTRDWKTSMFFPDTVLSFDLVFAPLINIEKSILSQNVPNPFDCTTRADLFLNKQENVQITVTDASGRVYLQFNDKLDAGTHNFEITLAKPQTYFLNASAGDKSSNIKMVNLGSCGTNAISLQSSSDELPDEIQLKNLADDKMLITTNFQPGDLIQYTGYTTYRNLVFSTTEQRYQQESEIVKLLFNIPFCINSTNVVSHRACDSFTWELNNNIYATTSQRADSVMLATFAACDSLVVLDITIDHSVLYDTIPICQPYLWYGNVIYPEDILEQELQQEINIPGIEIDPDNACSSVFVFATFVKIDPPTREFSITQCEPYLWNERYYGKTGTYTQTVQNEGCDSVITLHLHSVDSVEIDIIACDSYTWNEQSFTETGDYDMIFTNQHGCDSVVTMHLTIKERVTNEFSKVACNQFVWNEQTYTESGDYEQVFSAANGCDSVVTLHLTINNAVTNEFSEVACFEYIWNEQTYTETGSYTQTFEAVNGCDSVVTLQLTINQQINQEVTEVSCIEYTWNEQTYTETGDYIQTFIAANGCDSVVTLHLTINQPVSHEISENACVEYTWNEQTYTESGSYEQTFSDVNGCDSVVTLHLTINQPVSHEISEAACIEYTWNAETYLNSGDYVQTLTAANGCDSVVTLHLTIKQPVRHEFTDFACSEFTWNEQTYTASGDYEQIFTAANGCDSIVTLHLTIYPLPVLTINEIAHCGTYALPTSATDTWVWTNESDIVVTSTDISGNYKLTATTEHNCIDDTTITITIKEIPEINVANTTRCGIYILPTSLSTDVWTWTDEDNNPVTEVPEAAATITRPYIVTSTAENGCTATASIMVTTIVGEGPAIDEGIVDISLCEGYPQELPTNSGISGIWIFNGGAVTLAEEQGIYTIFVFDPETTCENTKTIRVDVTPTVYYEFSATACGEYNYGGTSYTETGDYVHTFPHHNTGCDSVVTLHLTINERISITRNDITEEYCTNKYGNKVWMTENLKYLPRVNNSYGNEKYYVYNHSGTSTSAARSNVNFGTYGVLYNYEAALTACPTGWHLPSVSEWQELLEYLSLEDGNKCNEELAKSLAYNELWEVPYDGYCAVGYEQSRNNYSGFSGKPGGMRSSFGSSGSYLNQKKEASWWTTTSDNTSSAYIYKLIYDGEDVRNSPSTKTNAHSVRCVKDDVEEEAEGVIE